MMALRASDEILAKNLNIIRHNLSLLEQFIMQNSDLFEWVRPRAGAVAFVRFKGPLTSEEFGRELAACGISVKPAYCFTDLVTDDIDYFRVGFGEESIPSALAALAAFVEERRPHWIPAGVSPC